jgi:hypothetical protein
MEEIMKKYFIVVLFFIAVLFLNGCGGGSSSTITGPDTSSLTTGSTTGSTSTTTTTSSSTSYYIDVKSASSPSTVTRGTAFDVTYTVDANLQTIAIFNSPVWNLNVYLATSNSLGTVFTTLGGTTSYQNGVLDKNISVTASSSTVSKGSYYLIVYAVGLGTCSGGSCTDWIGIPVTVN